ncbi:MAG: fibronectin type III domain-containing protein [Acidobacteria bacterium]|nr:fibronectin type III domain-containing protein [Acidobacteriota bacterium]
MRSRRFLFLASLLSALPLLAANPAVTINVNGAANRHAIDPRIYGSAWATQAQVADLGLTLNRWGGNAVSRYNWAFSTANRCKDYYFENVPDDVSSGDGSNGKSADDFIQATRNGGAEPVMTVPLMGLLPKDRSYRCGFSIAKYGAQDENDAQWRPDCGNGKQGGNRMLHVNDPLDTAASFTATHQANWIQHLVATWGAAGAGGVRYYSLDNEPSLWSFDHWDVHPDGSTYDEVWAKMAEYGAAIKAKDPGAKLTGIEEWGWSGYFMSGKDQEHGDNADRLAHGNKPYIDWLLDQAKQYEIDHSVRVLDVAAVHFYPQSGEFSDDVSSSQQQRRNRSTRSLWDPTYTDESWIGGTESGGAKVRLIPRLKEWVTNHYPGTEIGITEYNWGAESHINGATAQADILGIFGREGLNMGVRWTTPPTGSLVYNAMKMYRNYDGAHSKFGDTSVSASGPNPDSVAAFAAVRSSDSALTVMIVSKALSGDTPATVSLAGFLPHRTAAGKRWQLTSTNTIAHLGDVALASNALSLTLPAQSITLLVIPGATAPGAPTIGTATPGNGTATISFTPPANDGGSDITGYTATCVPGSISANGSASPITVSGLTNNVGYDCSVVAINAAGTSAPSATVHVTPTGGGGTPAITATANATPQVALSWTGVGGSTSYEVYRSVNNGAFALVTTTASTSANDNAVVANTTYLYKVRAFSGGVWGAYSAIDPATTVAFVDEPLSAGTQIKAAHVQQLRIAANAIRAAAGLGAAAFTDPTLAAGATVKAVHITELRTAINQARSAIVLSALSYTDPTLTPSSTTVKTVHVSELRGAVK